MHYICEGIHIIVCECVCVHACVCVCVCAARGSVCRVAVQRPAQSQSSHLPAGRLEIEAVFAQLTPSRGQDKHAALYTYTSAVRLPFTEATRALFTNDSPI